MGRYSVRDIGDISGPFVRYEGTEREVTWQEAVDFYLDPQYRLIEDALEGNGRARPKSLMRGQDTTTTSPGERQHLREWEDRRENGEVYFSVEPAGDPDGRYRVDLEPRDDADPHRLRNPFSIFKAIPYDGDGNPTDARLGVRIARHYSNDLIGETAIDPLPQAVYEASGPHDYDPEMLDGLHWVQEDELFAAARNGLDQDLIDLGLPPLTRTDTAVAEIVDDPRFAHAEREVIYLYDWLHTPYFGGISPRIAAEFGRREGTDTLLGLDKTRDRKPSEYLRESRPGYGEYILHCDPEFYLLTTNERRLAGGEIGDSRQSFSDGMAALSAFGDDLGDTIPAQREERFKEVQKELLDDRGNLTPLLVMHLQPHTDYGYGDLGDRLPGTEDH